jgi:hypothetical protein
MAIKSSTEKLTDYLTLSVDGKSLTGKTRGNANIV